VTINDKYKKFQMYGWHWGKHGIHHRMVKCIKIACKFNFPEKIGWAHFHHPTDQYSSMDLHLMVIHRNPTKYHQLNGMVILTMDHHLHCLGHIIRNAPQGIWE
jgi:hypothetical protein